MPKTNVNLRLGTDRKQNEFLGLPDYPCELFYTDLARHSTGYIPEHWHSEMEFGYVTEGCLLLTCNGKEYTVEADQFYFINANVLHSMKSAIPSVSFYSIVFHEKFLAMPEQIQKKYVHPVASNTNFPVFFTKESEFLSSIKAAIQCYLEKTEKFDFFFYQHVCSLWMRLFDRCLPLCAPEKDTNRRIREMLQFIASNYHRNIGVEEIAAFAGISKRECFRCFKRQLNSSPNIYLLQYRMNRAAELILMTDHKINRISAMCGFASATYFATKFKEIYGMSPTAYRDGNRNE